MSLHAVLDTLKNQLELVLSLSLFIQGYPYESGLTLLRKS